MKTNQLFKNLLLLTILSGFIMTTSCSKDDGPQGNNLTGILTYGFTDPVIKDYPFEVDNIKYVIKNNDSLPYEFDASSLIAQFTTVAGTSVKVAGVEQLSGSTVNDFSNDLVYTVTSEDGSSTKDYKVQINIAQLNPEAFQWRQKSPNAFDSTFETQEYFYLNGKHWVVAGKKFKWFGNAPESKLYSSTDGSSWDEVTPTGDFPVGFNHNIVVSNNKAYVVGVVTGADKFGSDEPILGTALYTTEDGIAWTKSEDALDAARILTPLFDVNNNIYAFGGNLQGAFSAFDGAKPLGSPFYPAASISETTLISSGGSAFVPSGEYTEDMPRRTKSAGFVHNDKMYVVGGLSAIGEPLDDVWSSTDGVNWTEVSTGGFTARIKASTVVYDDKVYMIGGQLADGKCVTDALVSSDAGVTWAPIDVEQSLPSNFKARCNADVSVDADGYIWIVGGEEVTSVEYNEEGVVSKIEYKVLTDVWSGKLNSLD